MAKNPSIALIFVILTCGNALMIYPSYCPPRWINLDKNLTEGTHLRIELTLKRAVNRYNEQYLETTQRMSVNSEVFYDGDDAKQQMYDFTRFVAYTCPGALWNIKKLMESPLTDAYSSQFVTSGLDMVNIYIHCDKSIKKIILQEKVNGSGWDTVKFINHVKGNSWRVYGRQVNAKFGKLDDILRWNFYSFLATCHWDLVYLDYVHKTFYSTAVSAPSNDLSIAPPKVLDVEQIGHSSYASFCHFYHSRDVHNNDVLVCRYVGHHMARRGDVKLFLGVDVKWWQSDEHWFSHNFDHGGATVDMVSGEYEAVWGSVELKKDFREKFDFRCVCTDGETGEKVKLNIYHKIERDRVGEHSDSDSNLRYFVVVLCILLIMFVYYIIRVYRHHMINIIDHKKYGDVEIPITSGASSSCDVYQVKKCD
ncbi:membrane glycoprotein [Suid betaherpesvirus 2]|uniref:Membrane glycoprotein n=1 Tax=Suid betaherpesvirus 2 TaxID=1608255 RepID=U3GTC1_9BETA|nr:membrane glycoprotein [Suid betaherpesvirus 2]AGT99217.1 membrane glycoprotein [Suid betaherpesvirus 2]